MNICLIPFTRLHTVQTAIDSAENNKWNVITLHDKDLKGMNVSREQLLNTAFTTEAKLIRYLDDDDILLPHLEQVQNIFEQYKSIDIVYTNFIINTDLIKLTGDPKKDAENTAPWMWIAKKETLEQVQRHYGYVWDQRKQCRTGGWCWYNFLKAKLSFKHLSISSYQWNKNSQTNHTSNHPNFDKESKLLHEALAKLH
jgi:hypothetical protein